MNLSRAALVRLTVAATLVVFVLGVVPALLVVRAYARHSDETQVLVEALLREQRAAGREDAALRSAVQHDFVERRRDIRRYGGLVVLRGLLASSFVAACGMLLIRARSNAALARMDEVSGLANRRAFVEHLEELLERRHPDGRLAVLYVDLDGFKPVNDAYGHAVGDRVLRTCGQRLRAALRPDDVVARLGGDEFGVILSRVDPPAAAAVAERLRAIIEQPIPVGEQSALVGASIGIAVVPEDGTSAGAVLRAADEAMYRRKRARRELAPA